MWSVALVLFAVCALRQPEWRGDSREYLAYARAFAAHLSPAIRQEDVEWTTRVLRESDPTFESLLAGGSGRLGKGLVIGNYMFIRMERGHFYSYHFWLYSAFIAPFLLLTSSLGVSALTAFALANLTFVVLALSYLAFVWVASAFAKQTLAALFMLTGTTFYVWWPHPEVFTACALLVASMAISDRHWVLAMFVTALAATQNPPLIIFLGVLAVGHAAQPGLVRGAGHSVRFRLDGSVRVLGVTLAAFTIALLPLAFFYSTLGVLNPISAAGAADVSFMSWSRMFSLYFDLNQGMIVAIPGVFLGVAILGTLGVARLLRRGPGALSSWRPLVAGVTISVITSVATLSAENWNSGQSVFMRYAYWLSVPLTVGFVSSLEALPRGWRTLLGIVAIASQVGIVMSYGIWGKHADYLALKPAAAYVMKRYPRLYNPVPEIFVERTLHREWIPRPEPLVFRYPTSGMPSKVLVRASRAGPIVETLRSECDGVSVAAADGGWVYVNVSGNCRAREPA